MSDSDKTVPTNSSWSRILERIAAICGIFAIPLSVYFYFESIRLPELTFSRNPSKLEVVSMGTSSKLSVDYNGKQILNDISIAQIALWNQGKSPIKGEDILQQIIVKANADIEILDAAVRKTSRVPIQFAIETSQLENNQIPVTWKVLEQGDGGVIEVIYVGAPDVEFSVEGAILGQKDISRYNNTLGFKSPEEEFDIRRTANRRAQLFFLPFSLASLIGLIFTLYKIIVGRKNQEDFIRQRIAMPIMAGLLLILTILGFYVYLLSKYPIPPPGI